MSDKLVKKRKPGAPAHPKAKTALRLIRPSSEPPTTDLITELSQEVKIMLQDMNRKHSSANEDDTPDAA